MGTSVISNGLGVPSARSDGFSPTASRPREVSAYVWPAPCANGERCSISSCARSNRVEANVRARAIKKSLLGIMRATDRWLERGRNRFALFLPPNEWRASPSPSYSQKEEYRDDDPVFP